MSGHGKPRRKLRPMDVGSKRGPSVPPCAWCGIAGGRSTRDVNGRLVPLCPTCIERLGSGEHPCVLRALEKRFPAEGGES